MNDVHPDGDPFAEQDALNALNTPLGRMEARALEEQRALEAKSNGAPSSNRPHSSSLSSTGSGRAPIVAPPGRSSQRTTPSLFASPRNAPAPLPLPSSAKKEVIVLDDSDTEDQDMSEVTRVEKEDIKIHIGEMEEGEGLNKEAAGDKSDVVMQDAPLEQATTNDKDPPLPSGSNVPDQHIQSGAAAPPAAPLASTSTSTSNNVTSETPVPIEVDPPSTSNAPPAPVPAPAVVRKKQGSPSPPPPPQKSPPPPRTVRLSITLPPRGTATEVPEYSVADMALSEGFGVVEDEDKQGGSGSGSGDDSGSESDGGTKKEKKDKDKENEKDGDKMQGIESEEKKDDTPAPVVPAVSHFS